MNKKDEITNDDFSKKKEKLSNEQRIKKIIQIISKNRSNMVESIFSLKNHNGITSISVDSQQPNSNNLTVSDSVNKQPQQMNMSETQTNETLASLLSYGNSIQSQQIQQLFKQFQASPKSNTHPNSIVQFTMDQNIIHNPICEKCKKPMKIGQHKKYLEQSVWRCYSKQCDKSRYSLYHKHKIFSGFRCNLLTLLRLFIQYLPSQAFVSDIQRELDLDKTTITNARQVWQSIVRHYYKNLYKEIQLGADTQVVEADEACFRRKYNRGRLLKRNQWVFGATERDGGFARTIFIPVANRNKATLTSLIKQFISPDCTLLVTDMWRGYSVLKEEGYAHYTVNHSTNFVLPSNNHNNYTKSKNINQIQRNYQREKGHLIHSQTIENRWTHVKTRLKRLKGQRKNYLNDIFDSLFYLSHKDNLERQALNIIIDYIQNNEQQQTEECINLFNNLSLEEDNQQQGEGNHQEADSRDDDDDGSEQEMNIYEYEEDSDQDDD